MDEISSLDTKTKRNSIDGAIDNKGTKRAPISFVHAHELLRRHRQQAHGSWLFTRGKRTDRFFTSDSYRYASAWESDLATKGIVRHVSVGKFDSLHARFIYPGKSAGEILYERLRSEYFGFRNSLVRLPQIMTSHVSPMKVWNASLVAALFFGMFSMTLIYRYLGQQASADSDKSAVKPVAIEASVPPTVLGASTETPQDQKEGKSELDVKSVDEDQIMINLHEQEQKKFETEVRTMVKGYPIEEMLPYIFEQDRTVAVFLIGIAKKESNWGKRIPVLNGANCYNYWGYRAIRDRMGSGGHTCFDNPSDAVYSVSKRIKKLVEEEKLNTPAKMVIWKCGYSCSGHSKESVRKWIQDVNVYFQALQD